MHLSIGDFEKAQQTLDSHPSPPSLFSPLLRVSPSHFSHLSVPSLTRSTQGVKAGWGILSPITVLQLINFT